MTTGNGRIVVPVAPPTNPKPFLPTGLSQRVPPAGDSNGPGEPRRIRISQTLEARIEAVASSKVTAASNFSELARLALIWMLEICEPALNVSGFSNLALDVREYVSAVDKSAEIDMQDIMYSQAKKFCDRPTFPGAIEEAERIQVRLYDPSQRDELSALIAAAKRKRG